MLYSQHYMFRVTGSFECKQQLAMAFHEAMSPFYQSIMSNNHAVMFHIKRAAIFTAMDFPRLFSKCRAKSRNAICRHLCKPSVVTRHCALWRQTILFAEGEEAESPESHVEGVAK